MDTFLIKYIRSKIFTQPLHVKVNENLNNIMNENQPEIKLGFLNILVLVLSVYVLGTLVIDTFFKLPTEVSRIIDLTDYFICAFFFLEF